MVQEVDDVCFGSVFPSTSKRASEVGVERGWGGLGSESKARSLSRSSSRCSGCGLHNAGRRCRLLSCLLCHCCIDDERFGI